ncbi:hypothetical protein FCR2A7T_06850 [Flavobacterium cauense R2A-7]|nr:hypothetical protein FCR2A7T_06850 [Flavobacterium cauense R2A-7]
MYIWLKSEWSGLGQYKPKLRKAGGTLTASMAKLYAKNLSDNIT